MEIPQESAGMGTACAATDLTPGLGFSHRCGSKVNSVKRVKGVLGPSGVFLLFIVHSLQQSEILELSPVMTLYLF